MSVQTYGQMANFIWSICNLLRRPYKRNEYRKVILPLVVSKIFDNSDFGYNKITVERPLRLNFQASDDWLGEVPEHWEVWKLKFVVNLKRSEGITIESIEDEGKYPVFGGNGLRGYAYEYTHEGEFVLIGRQGALCGNINYASGKFWASEHAVIATPCKSSATFWLGELLRVMNLNQYSISAAQPGLSIDRVKELFLPFTPLPEQQAIAEFLIRETARIDVLVSKVEKVMDKLKEYRTALISAALTGKIDVREEL